MVEPGIDGGRENFAHLGTVPTVQFSGVGMKLWGCSSGFVLGRSSPAMGFVRHGLILTWKNLTGLHKALTSTRGTFGLLLSHSRPTLVPDLINALLNVWAQKHLMESLSRTVEAVIGTNGTIPPFLVVYEVPFRHFHQFRFNRYSYFTHVKTG